MCMRIVGFLNEVTKSNLLGPFEDQGLSPAHTMPSTGNFCGQHRECEAGSSRCYLLEWIVSVMNEMRV